MKRSMTVSCLVAICLTLSTACTPKTQTAIPSNADLTVSLLYPTETTELEMGQSLKGIIKVLDERGKVVENAQVTLSVSDPGGNFIASIPSTYGSGSVYRTDAWTIPHKMQAGSWTLTAEAKTDTHEGTATRTFRVKDSFSETLLHKYGFWVDPPTLRGIVPSLVKEQGDAHNGLIALGAVIPTQHVFPENWLEVQWREGNFNLLTADEVRRFMLDTLGNPGVYPTRSLESFERTRFKNWDAWLVRSRGQLSRYDEQWMIFYSPEVDKTYAIGTTVVLPPVGIDAHAVLRAGFEVHPEIRADGVAPKPLDQLLPPVELTGPELGTRFFGTDRPIILKWRATGDLAEDEYYLVRIDYNYEEANPSLEYATRETRFILPDSLYDTPNCGVFNWQVTLMRRTGTGQDGQPTGIALSDRSLYWFVLWMYPSGREAPFKPLCPNEQY